MVVRHLAHVIKGPRASRDFGIDSTAGKTVFFWWRTEFPQNERLPQLVWGFNPTAALQRHLLLSINPGTSRRLPPHPKRGYSRPLRHGLYRNNVRGHITTMGSAAYGANLVNAVEGLKSRGDMAPYAYSLNKSGAVSGQWLISTPEGTVAVLKAGGDDTVYLATTLEPAMAAAQTWVCNPPQPPYRSNNDRTFSQGGIA